MHGPEIHRYLCRTARSTQFATRSKYVCASRLGRTIEPTTKRLHDRPPAAIRNDLQSWSPPHARTWLAAIASPRPGPGAGKARANQEAAHRTVVRPRQHPPSAAHTAGKERAAGRRGCVCLTDEKDLASFAVSGSVRKVSYTMEGVLIPTNALFRRSIVGEMP